MENLCRGLRHSRMARSEQDDLSAYRLQRFVHDSDSFALSVGNATRRADTEALLAEIDGVFAGLNYLENTEKHLSTTPIEKLEFVPLYGDCTSYTHSQLPDLPEELLLVDPTQISTAPQQQEDAPQQEGATQHQEKASQKERAWLALKSLRQGIQNEFLKFDSLRSVSTCPKITKLGDYYPDAEALGQMGILTYRDVLHGVLPETLAEVFSFACLSFVMSTLLCRKGRIRRDQILAGLHQWRDSICDDDEKLTLDTLASAMWPVGVSGDRYQSVEQCPNGDIRPVNSASRNLDSFSANDPRTFSDPNKASEASSQTEDLPSIGVESLSAPFNTGLMSDLEQDACGLLGISHEEFNFAQFCNEADSNISGSQTVPSHQARPTFTDPRDLTQSGSVPIPRYADSLLYSPLSFPTYAPLPTEYPFRDPSSNTDTSQLEIKLHILEKTSDHPTFTLKNTPMFLVVLAFGKENGTVFFSFSGSGQTVVCERRGSAFSSAKSKQEKTLREEFFEPLRKAMSGNPSFLALLSVAQRFVLLGNMGTLQQVRVFLLNIAEPFLDHRETVKAFIQEVERYVPGSPSSSSKKGELNIAQGSFRCTFPGCKKAYKDSSGLLKHRKARHQGGAQQIHCPEPGCRYSSHRRDAVRQHFTRRHCLILPPSLQEKRPRHL